jgi:hypothetical protein
MALSGTEVVTSWALARRSARQENRHERKRVDRRQAARKRRQGRNLSRFIGPELDGLSREALTNRHAR